MNTISKQIENNWCYQLEHLKPQHIVNRYRQINETNRSKEEANLLNFDISRYFNHKQVQS